MPEDEEVRPATITVLFKTPRAIKAKKSKSAHPAGSRVATTPPDSKIRKSEEHKKRFSIEQDEIPPNVFVLPKFRLPRKKN